MQQKQLSTKPALMRNTCVYYFLIIVPLLTVFIMAKKGWISNSEFVILLLLYVLYRQFTDAYRLKARGIIKEVNWKVIINPTLQMKYFKELYLQ